MLIGDKGMIELLREWFMMVLGVNYKEKICDFIKK